MIMFLLAPVAWRKHSHVLFALTLVFFAWCNADVLRIAASWTGLLSWAIAMAVAGLVPAAIAYREHRSFLDWWLYGTVQFSSAFASALRLQTIQNPDGTLRRCPRCHRWIQAQAVQCNYCENEVEPLSDAELAAQRRAAKETIKAADQLPRWIGR